MLSNVYWFFINLFFLIFIFFYIKREKEGEGTGKERGRHKEVRGERPHAHVGSAVDRHMSRHRSRTGGQEGTKVGTRQRGRQQRETLPEQRMVPRVIRCAASGRVRLWNICKEKWKGFRSGMEIPEEDKILAASTIYLFISLFILFLFNNEKKRLN